MNYLHNCLKKNICFWCVKEKSPSDISFTHQKRMFDRKTLIIIIFEGYIFLRVIYFYVYLPIIRTFNSSK